LVAVLAQVSLGVGVAVVPSLLQGVIELPQVVFRALAGARIPSELGAVYRRHERDPAVRAFLQQLPPPRSPPRRVQDSGWAAGVPVARDRGFRMSQVLHAAELLEAVMFAAERHRQQRRKDAEASPYINHPIALAHLLATTGGVDDLAVLQAAILHDTIEDTDTTEAELQARFGPAVAAMVMEVTDDKALAKAERKALQVAHAPHKSPGAALVKLADKTCNLRDMAAAPPAGWDLARRQEYFDWARQVVEGLPRVNDALRAAFDLAYAARPVA
jgi:guanosine-3',5'-bis(diphosphate) 3'-pyrophosphohydrolase